MKITVIGTGYVGLVTGTILAEKGNQVVCLDIDQEKIAQLRQGNIPFFEPKLKTLVQKNCRLKRLSFQSKFNLAASQSKVFFIAVGTPPKKNGSAELKFVFQAARQIGAALKQFHQTGYRVIVDKSTVPIGTAQKVSHIIQKFYPTEQFEVISNPEFLREGQAVQDSLFPDRIVLGLTKTESKQTMLKLFKPFECPKLITNIQTAEMIKYASNCFLATSISFINSLARLCEKVGADITQVSAGMRLDKRIGKRAFLDAGVGYGGSCFPKDVQALIKIGQKHRTPLTLLEETEKINQQQRKSIIAKIKKIYPNLNNKKIVVWGLAFKPETDDLREAPSLPIIKALLKEGAQVVGFDPVAEKKAQKMLPQLNTSPDPYQPLTDADLLIILTEWKIFTSINKKKMKKLMKKPIILDGRNIYSPSEMKKLGFRYFGVGK